MKTINEDINKLHLASQKRDEFSRNLDEYILVHQDSLPQEFIDTWGRFEVVEKEARTIETKAIKGIEREIRNGRLVKKFDVVMRVMVIGLFVLSIGHIFSTSLSAINSVRYPRPRGLGGCNSLSLFRC